MALQGVLLLLFLMGHKMNYALVNTENNIVENLIVLEEGAVWSPPQGHIIVAYEQGVILGSTWNGSEFVAPAPRPVENISDGVQNVIG